MGERKEIKHEIVQQIGIISRNSKGWTKEMNLIKWNDNPAKYDIRDWSPDHSAMSKGITLTDAEVFALKEMLNERLK